MTNQNRKSENPIVKVVPLRKGANFPKYMHSGDSGADLYASIEAPVTIPAGLWQMIKTGIAIELPSGYEAQVRSRSGLAGKSGIFVLNGIGTLDQNFSGEICVILANFSKVPFVVKPDMRIAQLVIAPVVRGDFTEKTIGDLTKTDRNSNGFGSTGL